MNKGTLPIIARLRSLQTPAHIAAGGARVIADTSNPSPLTELLREVNETILGRALRFESSDGTSLTLEAAGRRVLRLTDASGLPGAEGCLAAEVLEDENKDDLIKLMQALAKPRNTLRVSISARGVAGEGISVGLPVALLADLLLIELNDPSGPGSAQEIAPPKPRAEARPEPRPELRPEPRPAPAPEPPAPLVVQPVAKGGAISLVDFVQALAPTVMAWVIRGGAADGSTDGPEEMVTHLQGFLDDETASLHHQLDLVSGSLGTPACMVLGSAIVEGQGVLCARSGDGLLLGLFDGNPSQSLIRAWAEARG